MVLIAEQHRFNYQNLSDIQPKDIIFARKRSKISQNELASILGISVRTLESWERGHRKPSRAAQSLLRLFIRAPNLLVTYLT
ncbi:helix-turn-helix domain-containing protein [Acinetobacter sp. ANC 4639]